MLINIVDRGDAPDYELLGVRVRLDDWNPFLLRREHTYVFEGNNAGFGSSAHIQVSRMKYIPKQMTFPLMMLEGLPYRDDFSATWFGRLDPRGHINRYGANIIERSKRPVVMRNRYA